VLWRWLASQLGGLDRIQPGRDALGIQVCEAVGADTGIPPSVSKRGRIYQGIIDAASIRMSLRDPLT
jgi:hypothetical protein